VWQGFALARAIELVEDCSSDHAGGSAWVDCPGNTLLREFCEARPIGDQ
jgi:hypothetical protein